MTMAARILIVEDDPDIAELVARYLEKAAFETDRAASGRDALQMIAVNPPALVVLDLMLPHVDGLEICRRLRSDQKTAAIPLIMLTARAEESDRVLGLEVGADDYVTKPFSARELLARVRAVVRRAQGKAGPVGAPLTVGRELGADDYLAKPFSPNELVARVRALLRRAQRQASDAPAKTLTYGAISVDSDRHVVSAGGRDVTLTAKEFLLLEYLLQHRGRVLSRDVLLTDVWGYRYTGGTRTVDVHVRRLREKLPLLAEALVTVKQFGYKLVDPAPLTRA